MRYDVALLAAAAIVLFGIHLLQFSGYLADDAAITFAYAKNAAVGHGLVLNPGTDPVEGYSNFGWLAVVLPFRARGADPTVPVKILSFIIGAVTLWLLALLVAGVSALAGRTAARGGRDDRAAASRDRLPAEPGGFVELGRRAIARSGFAPQCFLHQVFEEITPDVIHLRGPFAANADIPIALIERDYRAAGARRHAAGGVGGPDAVIVGVRYCTQAGSAGASRLQAEPDVHPVGGRSCRRHTAGPIRV